MAKKETSQSRTIGRSAITGRFATPKSVAASALSQIQDRKTASYRAITELDSPSKTYEVRRKEYSQYRVVSSGTSLKRKK